MTTSSAAVRRVKLPRRKQQNDEGRMTLIEHLKELRNRLSKAVGAILLVTLVCLFFAYNTIQRTIEKPYCNVPIQHRFGAQVGQPCTLIISGPLDGFTFRFKIALIAGLVLSSPIWLWQIWRFVTPGLHKKERRYGLGFILGSTLLFAAGATLAYFVLGKSLDALLSFGGNGVQALLTADRYLSFVLAMIVAFGLGFEFPLIVLMLNFAGLLPSERLRKWRRMAFFLCVVFAGIAVPSSDPFSMLILAIPLCVLYEVTIVIARLHDRAVRRRPSELDFGDLADDQASPLPTASAPILASPIETESLELSDYT